VSVETGLEKQNSSDSLEKRFQSRVFEKNFDQISIDKSENDAQQPLENKPRLKKLSDDGSWVSTDANISNRNSMESISEEKAEKA
jgi:hypothetical protein